MTRLLEYLLSIVINQRKIMSALTDLQAAVAANSAAIGAATALIAQDKATIAAQAAQILDLQSQITDQAALAALTTQLGTDDTSLTAATGAAPSA